MDHLRFRAGYLPRRSRCWPFARAEVHPRTRRQHRSRCSRRPHHRSPRQDTRRCVCSARLARRRRRRVAKRQAGSPSSMRSGFETPQPAVHLDPERADRARSNLSRRRWRSSRRSSARSRTHPDSERGPQHKSKRYRHRGRDTRTSYRRPDSPRRQRCNRAVPPGTSPRHRFHRLPDSRRHKTPRDRQARNTSLWPHPPWGTRGMRHHNRTHGHRSSHHCQRRYGCPCQRHGPHPAQRTHRGRRPSRRMHRGRRPSRRMHRGRRPSRRMHRGRRPSRRVHRGRRPSRRVHRGRRPSRRVHRGRRPSRRMHRCATHPPSTPQRSHRRRGHRWRSPHPSSRQYRAYQCRPRRRRRSYRGCRCPPGYPQNQRSRQGRGQQPHIAMQRTSFASAAGSKEDGLGTSASRARRLHGPRRSPRCRSP